MRRIAFISEHASPLACLGGVDAGGQNVYVGQLARHLARRGYAVDVFTRRDDPAPPAAVPWGRGARVIHVPAGPPERVRKEDLLPHMGAFADYFRRYARRRGYARACMEELLQWFRERGVPHVDLNASAEAEALYASLGFVRKPDPSMRLTF